MTDEEQYDLNSVYSVGEGSVDDIVSDELADNRTVEEPSRYRSVKGSRNEKSPIQFFKDLTIAEVLGRGTLCEEEEKQRLGKIKGNLKSEINIIDDEWGEIRKAAFDIENVLKSKKPKCNKDELFESIVQTVERELKVGNIEYFGAEGQREINISELAMQLIDSSSEDEISDEHKSACSLTNPKEKEEEKSETAYQILSAAGSARTVCSLKITSNQLLEGNSDDAIKGAVEACEPTPDGDLGGVQTTQSREKRCFERAMIEKSKMIIALKKRLFRALKVQTEWLTRNPSLMKHKLYRQWTSNMEDALKVLNDQIANQEESLKLQLEMMKREKLFQDETPSSDDDDVRSLHGDSLLFTLDQMKGALNMIDCKRKHLMEQHNAKFFNKRTNACQNNAGHKVLKLLKTYNDPSNSGSSEVDCPGALVVAQCLPTGDELTTEVNLGPEQKVQELFTGTAQSSSLLTTSLDSNNKSNIQITAKSTNSRLQQFICKSIPFITPETLEGCLNVFKKFLTDAECNLIIKALDLERSSRVENDKGKTVDCKLTESPTKDEFAKCSSQVLYIFKYELCYLAVDIEDAYYRYIHQKNLKKHVCGCLLLYNNVNLGIVLVEGRFDQVMEHLAFFKHSDVYNRIEFGRVLFCKRPAGSYFSEWISVNVSNEPEKQEYLFKEKKILDKVAKPRVSQLIEKLKSLYTFLADPKNRDGILHDLFGADRNSENITTGNIRNCGCKEASYSSIRRAESKKPSTADLLPPYALVEYLLRYRSLKSLDRFLDDLAKQPLLDSDDEVFDTFEETKLGRYIDNELWDQPESIEDVKKTYKLQEILMKIKKEFNEKLTLEARDGEPPWLKEYDLKMFTPCVAQVEIRKHDDKCQRKVINVNDLIDSDEDHDSASEDRFMRFEIKQSEKFSDGGKFCTAGDGEMEAPRKWKKKCVKLGLKGHELKEMLADSQKYKELIKAMHSKRKVDGTEYSAQKDFSVGLEEESDGEVGGEEEEVGKEEELGEEVISFLDADTSGSIAEQTEEINLEEAENFHAGESALLLSPSYEKQQTFDFNGEDPGEFYQAQPRDQSLIRMIDFENPEDGEVEDDLSHVRSHMNETGVFGEPEVLGETEILGEPDESYFAVPKSVITLVDSSTGPMLEDENIE